MTGGLFFGMSKWQIEEVKVKGIVEDKRGKGMQVG